MRVNDNIYIIIRNRFTTEKPTRKYNHLAMHVYLNYLCINSPTISTAGGSLNLYFISLFSSVHVHLYIYNLLPKAELLMH